MKLGNQYGCGEQLNCLMFITLFSYFRTAACGHNKHQNRRSTVILRIRDEFFTADTIVTLTATSKNRSAATIMRYAKTQRSYLVVVYVEIVGCTEDGDKRWEARRLRLSVHAVSGVLSLVRPYDAEQIVVLQEVATRRVTATEAIPINRLKSRSDDQ